MNSSAPVSPHHTNAPAMSELKTHNHLLGDLKALDRAWMQDGYWFFKAVLDRDAVARLRGKYVAELERYGVIDPPGDVPTEQGVRYNGRSLEDFPPRMEPLAKHEPWREFAAEPAVHEFFTRLLGAEPFWVPVAEYRATPPTDNRQRERFDYVHQDGPYSPGIAFRILWIPLARIDADVGGLALAEGLTEKINRHLIVDGTNKAIPLEALPPDSWRRTTYEAGDVLLMNLWTPHTGLSNLSDRFRLSLDIRIMAKTDRCPIIGKILKISPTALTIRGDGPAVELRIGPETYARNHMGEKLSARGIVDFFQIGATAIVAHEGGLATVVRPTH